MENLPKLSTGIQSFETIRKDGYIYADKTRLLYELLQKKAPCFLSRPRRFGKSLLISTLKAILQGKKELFKGLWIGGSNYDWEPYPVIHLRMNEIGSRSVDFVESSLIKSLKHIAAFENISIDGEIPLEYFSSLYHTLYAKYNKRVAILIDEYDAPIVKNLENTKLANDIRIALKDFYDLLKNEDLLGFIFITGVSKFVKTSIFSTLNNLIDLTFKDEYTSICGFTIEDFDTLFPEYMSKMLAHLKSISYLPQDNNISDLRDLIFDWYDGYSWDGETKLLNPWAILSAFEYMRFGDYWCQSGSRLTFIDSFIKSGVIDVNKLKPFEHLTEASDIIDLETRLDATPLMFQAGYLTVSHVDKKRGIYKYYLDFPNMEVKAGIIPLLLSTISLEDPLQIKQFSLDIVDSLINLDTNALEKSFENFIACYAYSIHETHEGYYHTLFQSAMFILGQNFDSLTSVSGGKLDLHYQAPNGTHFVFEFKYCSDKGRNNIIISMDKLQKNMVEKAAITLEQINARRYTQKFRGTVNDIYKVALVVGGRRVVLAVFKKEEDI